MEKQTDLALLNARLQDAADTEEILTLLAAEAASHADQTEEITFPMHPMAFPSSVPLSAALAAVGTVFFGLSLFLRFFAAAALVLFLCAFCVFFFERIRYRRLTDGFYPAREGRDVLLTRKAKEDARQHVLLCARVDAAPKKKAVWKRLPAVCKTVIGVIAFLGVPAAVIGSVLVLAADPAAALLYALIPAFAAQLFLAFSLDGKSADQADLSGALAALRVFADTSELGSTDLSILLLDGEEAGLRGSIAFAEERYEILTQMSTNVICFGSLQKKENLNLFTDTGREANRELLNLLYLSAQKDDIALKESTFRLFASDSVAFSSIGVKAVTLSGKAKGKGPADPAACSDAACALVEDAVRMLDRASNVFRE